MSQNWKKQFRTYGGLLRKPNHHASMEEITTYKVKLRLWGLQFDTEAAKWRRD
jgi:hypothetical protein